MTGMPLQQFQLRWCGYTAWAWMNAQGCIAVLGDATRGIVNDTFRQRFKSPDPEERGHEACVCRLSARLEQFHSRSF